MDPQDLLNAMQQQRNQALDQLAVCIAEGAQLARELKATQNKLAELTKDSVNSADPSAKVDSNGDIVKSNG